MTVKRIFEVELKELHTLRITCGTPDCGASFDVAVEKVGTSRLACPTCGADFYLTGSQPIQLLAKAIIEAGRDPRFRVSFPVDAGDAPA